MSIAQQYNFIGDFGIARWRAWSPGIRTNDDWLKWLDGAQDTPPDDQPDVSFLPALLRRRLDRYGRMALHTAWPCSQGETSVQTVFASRHGALNRTMELLGALARDETLSPTLFTLSVHNSVAGLLSIARKDRGAATAMAAGPDTLILSLLEGATMLQEGATRVLVIYVDDSMPEVYASQTASAPNRAFAVALLLTPVAESPLHCRLTGLRESLRPRHAPEVELMEFLLGRIGCAEFGAHQSWRLERRHAG
ncbi:MAG: beta-ketoacyl synthase chain length factor [Gammaproteobacteria bacterium]|nr:beta-ketoacyl synthase chain length factor [Gammaproteobacteria bacterium]MDE2344898.1 beta-ketoacyl synthase chain length factor [Gammaproteobacteria bacterium]